jgi:hypothetical protein
MDVEQCELTPLQSAQFGQLNTGLTMPCRAVGQLLIVRGLL